MELTIERRWKKTGYTIGVLLVNGERFCETLEDTDRGLSSEMPVGKINQLKLYGITAIPRGRYRVVLSVSPKFKTKTWGKKYGGLVPELLNVKGYDGVRIHPGSNANSTSGCPLVGRNKVVGGLVDSQKTYYALMDNYLMPAHKAGEEISITIK